ncbi:putative chitinase [Microsporum canis]
MFPVLDQDVASHRGVLQDGVLLALEYFQMRAGVNWITWDKTQWVSYDNEITFAQKINYANSLCLGGTMIWGK